MLPTTTTATATVTATTTTTTIATHNYHPPPPPPPPLKLQGLQHNVSVSTIAGAYNWDGISAFSDSRRSIQLGRDFCFLRCDKSRMATDQTGGKATTFLRAMV
ncbi:hypothetical protein L1987_74464 [Smallanthus sonchifolius]|uniref:Uncharacterized protein n=1 Tax=Smallanthus sonchifolius TaxID=185202 RepID=A0ACB9A312_9ASTR|nr:hypothetical protein L1987_74464 [Smallanthus sonchifolius]